MPDPNVIVGASLAGLRAAQAVRKGGHEGDLVVVGDEQRGPYTRPPLSKELLAGDHEPGQCDFDHAAVEAQWRLGEPATALDAGARRVTLASGDELAVRAPDRCHGRGCAGVERSRRGAVGGVHAARHRRRPGPARCDRGGDPPGRRGRRLHRLRGRGHRARARCERDPGRRRTPADRARRRGGGAALRRPPRRPRGRAAAGPRHRRFRRRRPARGRGADRRHPASPPTRPWWPWARCPTRAGWRGRG